MNVRQYPDDAYPCRHPPGIHLTLGAVDHRPGAGSVPSADTAGGSRVKVIVQVDFSRRRQDRSLSNQPIMNNAWTGQWHSMNNSCRLLPPLQRRQPSFDPIGNRQQVCSRPIRACGLGESGPCRLINSGIGPAPSSACHEAGHGPLSDCVGGRCAAPAQLLARGPLHEDRHKVADGVVDELLVSLCDDGTHSLFLHLGEPLKKPLDDLIQLSGLVGGNGVIGFHDDIIAGSYAGGVSVQCQRVGEMTSHRQQLINE